MHIATTELEGTALAIAVRMGQGFTFRKGAPESEGASSDACRDGWWRLNPNRDRWACVLCQCQGDELDFESLIANEEISLRAPRDAVKPDGTVVLPIDRWYAHINHQHVQNGLTPRLAAFRCFVASKLGAAVEIPDGLLA